MLKILFPIFLSVISCHAGFKAAVGLDFKAQEKEIFYDLIREASDLSASNYLYSYTTSVEKSGKKGKKSTVKKDISQTFSIFDGRHSVALVHNGQKEITRDGVDYRVTKESYGRKLCLGSSGDSLFYVVLGNSINKIDSRYHFCNTMGSF